ncbi:hypothetical protein DFH06DRAFT_1392467 [Mycena polygramma]|nr:hypothetical protein DFH06DRAFT_1392467 [Mycena polygramma]
MKSSSFLFTFAALLVDTYALPTQVQRGSTTPSVPSRPATNLSDTAATDFGANSNPTPRSTVSVQYHATCAKNAASIKTAMDNKVFSLRPTRRWPDELSWSGGFYVTPDQKNAEAYGAAFLRRCQKKRGGVVIMQFELDSSELAINPLAAGTAAQNFMDEQESLGTAIREYVEHWLPQPSDSSVQPPSPISPVPKPVVPPIGVTGEGASVPDVGISARDTVSKPKPPKIPPPIPTEIEKMRVDVESPDKVSSDLWEVYDAFAKYDGVIGAVPMNDYQQGLMDIAVKIGMPAIQNPFTQVVLVTNQALQKLRYVAQVDLNPAMAAKQPALEQPYTEYSKKYDEEHQSTPNQRRSFGSTDWV